MDGLPDIACKIWQPDVAVEYYSNRGVPMCLPANCTQGTDTTMNVSKR